MLDRARAPPPALAPGVDPSPPPPAFRRQRRRPLRRRSSLPLWHHDRAWRRSSRRTPRLAGLWAGSLLRAVNRLVMQTQQHTGARSAVQVQRPVRLFLVQEYRRSSGLLSTHPPHQRLSIGLSAVRAARWTRPNSPPELVVRSFCFLQSGIVPLRKKWARALPSIAARANATPITPTRVRLTFRSPLPFPVVLLRWGYAAPPWFRPPVRSPRAGLHRSSSPARACSPIRSVRFAGPQPRSRRRCP